MPGRSIPGLLLINLGTPASPHPRDVRPYLRQFLSDPRVLDVPAWKRWLVLNLFILPFRPRRSGEAYAKIWTERGSPLLLHSLELTRKVQQRLGDDAAVELGMRYGEPSIPAALAKLRRQGIDQITAFPLYPQYSSAATGSSLEVVYTEAARLWNTPYVQAMPPFFDDPRYLDCCARLARPHLEELDPEVVLFSFHGLPERHVRKSDDGGAHCLQDNDCCERIVEANRNCYRAHCFATARLLADRLRVAQPRRRVCFQSRLGRDPWIRPYTDELLAQLPRGGMKRALILSPAFVADCLETLEELGMQGVETWRANGGETLRLVPCLNADDDWVDAVVAMARPYLAGLGACAVPARLP